MKGEGERESDSAKERGRRIDKDRGDKEQGKSE